jgi:hypothetical protein
MSVKEFLKAHIRVQMKSDISNLSEAELVAIIPFFPKPEISYDDWVSQIESKEARKARLEEEAMQRNEYMDAQVEKAKAEEAQLKAQQDKE